VLGALPGFTVDSPWWPDVEPVVETARARFDVDVVVLRLLSTTTESPVMGGEVSYLAEVLGDPPAGLAPSGREVAGDDEPLRAPWARPGGVAVTIEWADTALATLGRPRTGPARQIKSWNLSSILLLPTAGGDVWSKTVPPFQGHEGLVLGLIADDEPSLVPPLLAADPASGTVLLGDVAGEDQWDAPEDVLREMVRRWVRTQSRWTGRVDELAAAGLPDWRAPSFPGLVSAMLRRDDVRAGHTAEELKILDDLGVDLPRRLSAIADCGLPETLVHGDFHPGNWRSDATSLVLLDWGDSGIGHPLLDLTAFLPRVPDQLRARVSSTWAEAWRIERPGTDAELAAELIGPVAALRQALIYRVFLDGIEPSERRYHELDVPFWLRRAIDEASPTAT
jgi:phosphotransferase family enzyme